MSDTPNTFAARLRSLRERAGRSIPDLAAVSGLTPQAIHQLERGERRPAWDTVLKLCEALDLTPNDFLPDGR
jgi:transcriptional regulator with XRE-family HTH domain